MPSVGIKVQFIGSAWTMAEGDVKHGKVLRVEMYVFKENDKVHELSPVL